MFAQARAALGAALIFILLSGIGYPLLVTGVGQLFFPAQAGGSLILGAGGEVLGSKLLAQGFSRPEYLHPRPSAAGADGYDAAGSSGSNLGPLNPKLADRIASDAARRRGEDGLAPAPADALTTSGSGLDPHISPENARMQAARIAKARGVSASAVQAIIDKAQTAPVLGIIGQPSINVLTTNLALDAAFAGRQPPPR